MSSLERDHNQYERSVETLIPQDVFKEVAAPETEKGPPPTHPYVPA